MRTMQTAIPHLKFRGGSLLRVVPLFPSSLPVAATVSLALGVAAVPAPAQTALVYESMNYTAGAGVLHGMIPDLGLSAWSVSPTGAGEIIAPGMSYTDANGDTLAVQGNRFETRPLFNDFARAAIDITNWSAANKDGGKLNKKGAVIWFSVLMSVQNTINYNKFWLEFTDSANGYAGYAGGPGYFAVGRDTVADGYWEIRGDNDDGDADAIATSTVKAGQETFILGRITTDGTSGDSTMEVWFNPLLDDEASLGASGDLSITVDANDDGSVTQFDSVGYRHQKWESPNLLDELRMGESYASVTPVAGSGGYAGWADTNAGGQGPDEDYNGNGVPNGVEYFMGGTLASPATMPALVDGGGNWRWTIPYDPSAMATWKIQLSGNLLTWDDYGDGDPAIQVLTGPDRIEFTLPAGGTGRKFVRLVVTTG